MTDDCLLMFLYYNPAIMNKKGEKKKNRGEKQQKGDKAPQII